MIETLDEYGFPIFEENEYPIAYLLTFRTFGTWLHGDKRGSMGRTGSNRFGTPGITPSVPFAENMSQTRDGDSVLLSAAQRKIIEVAIAEVCEHRGYTFRALNVRTNHVHSVISYLGKPEKVVNDFKAYSTRALRKAGEVTSDDKVWSRGASTRYLWKPRHVAAAIDYVLYCQEDIPFDFRDE